MSDASATASRAVLHSAVPTFLVADVAVTVEWYGSHLGFALAGSAPAAAPFVYASLQRGEAEIILLSLAGYQKPDLRNQRPAGLWDAYIRADGIGELYRSIEGKPFVESVLTIRPYGSWEFAVRDLNGYILVFGGAL